MAAGNEINRPQPQRPQAAIQQVSITATAQYSGALPPPEMLKGFEAVLPGSAERILKMAELEQTHRHAEESLARKSFDRETLLGQCFAFGIVLSAIGGAVCAGINNAQVVGSVLGTFGIGSIVAVFIFGRRRHGSKQV